MSALGLSDPALRRQQCYIDGRWTDASSRQTVAVRNPATGETLGTVPSMDAVEARAAIAAADRALPAWKSRSARDRADLLRRWHDLMLEHRDDLARLMTLEQGKPLQEAVAEVQYAASFIEWFAEEGKRLYGDMIPGHHPDKRILVLRQPVGVVAAITPWNFPAAMITRKAGPALAAGCTFVCKPALETPFSALALAELAARAGIPGGVFNVVTGSPTMVGREMVTNATVRKLTFTGSTAVGKKLMAQCADTLKKVSLELGGNAPVIVFDDADLDQAVQGVMLSKFRNSGQTCVCANRVYVQQGIHDAFVERLVAAVRTLRVGNGLDGASDQGPLIDQRAVTKVETHIADAISKGARLVLGGQRHALGGTFFEPTVITHATSSMLVARDETFGPLAPVFSFRDEDEVIRMANDTESGLASYFFTNDLTRALRVAERLEYGIVGINTGQVSTEVAPFGGIKESGTGREGSKYGILDYTELKYVCIGGL